MRPHAIWRALVPDVIVSLVCSYAKYNLVVRAEEATRPRFDRLYDSPLYTLKLLQ